MGLAKSDVVDLGFDVNNLRQAETVRSQIAVSIDGIDTPINVMSTNTLMGTDAAGNPVFSMDEIMTVSYTHLPLPTNREV